MNNFVNVQFKFWKHEICNAINEKQIDEKSAQKANVRSRIKKIMIQRITNE